ncbi:hypothetical protein ACROYT_G026385 [Oculina patagonica]
MSVSNWLSPVFLVGFSVLILRSTPQGVCPDNWIHFKGSCYKFFSNKVNWIAAKSTCEALGSKLVSINSRAEQQAIGANVTNNSLTVWIGLYRDPQAHCSWLWVDGSRPKYTNWYPDEPNDLVREGCGEMYPQSHAWKWNDLSCYLHHPFICETDACDCHLKGTVNRSSVCQGVTCDCDVGGSANGQTCDKVTGDCHCRPNVIGKSCNRTASGFYYPNSYFIQATGSPFKPSTDTLYVVLDIPKTGNYRLLVEYTNEHDEGIEAHTQVVVQFKNTSASGQQAGDLFIFSPSLQECVNCPGTINNEYLLMQKGQWVVNITTVQPYDQLKLDAVIAIPREFVQATVLGADLSSQFVFYCSVVGNDMSSDPRCLPWLFSITTDYLDGVLGK